MLATDMLSERRQSVRAPLLMPVDSLGDARSFLASDIGLGGLKCVSKRPRWPGTYLDLRFQLPAAPRPISLGAQVTNLDEADAGRLIMGMRFCQVSRGDQLELYRFLDSRRHLWSDDLEVIEHAPPAVAKGTELGIRRVVHPVTVERARFARAPLGARVNEESYPFARLLMEAYCSIQADEIRHQGCVRTPIPRDLLAA